MSRFDVFWNPVAPVAFGFLLDLLFGDPHWLPHPVRWIGRLISLLEAGMRRLFPQGKKGEQAGGILTTLLTLAVSTGIAYAVVALARWVHPAIGLAVETLICYQMLAARALQKESMRVFDALNAGNLTDARYAVSWIVGRDTGTLDFDGVAKAAVETVAENASDGVVAPLFYLLLGGVPLGVCYKAVNTLDSMIGYKNDRYLWFGQSAAHLDDLFNLVPSRLCALMMIATARLCGLDGKRAYCTWRRDRRNHASPNSAQTEAACAGALGVQLAGDAWYGGRLVRKPMIGDSLRPVEPGDIQRANRLMYAASAAALFLFGASRMLFSLFLGGMV